MKQVTTKMTESLYSFIANDGRTAIAPAALANIQSLSHLCELKRRSQFGYPTPLQWHPQLPLLCTTDDSAWWNTSGELLRSFAGYRGQWDETGALFHYLDAENPSVGATTSTTCAQSEGATIQYQLQQVPPILATAFKPFESAMTLITVDGVYEWMFLESQVRRFEGMTGAVRAEGSWNPTGDIFVCLIPTSSTNTNGPSQMFLWDRQGNLLNVIESPLPYAVPTWHPQGSCFVTHHQDRLRWWSRTGELIEEHLLPQSYISNDQPVAWSPDGALLAVTANEDIYVYTGESQFSHTISSPSGRAVASLVWHPSGAFLTSGYCDSAIRLWNNAGGLIHTIQTWLRPGDFATPFFLQWDTKGSTMAASLRNFAVHLYG